MLSTYTGTVVIFRLDRFDAMPYLKELLEDESIMKIGVDTQRQALYLFNDFDVRVASTFDLRFMASEPMDLKLMKRHYMQITSQINPYFPFESEYEQTLSVNARASIVLFRLFCGDCDSNMQPIKHAPNAVTVKYMIDTFCRIHLNCFYSDEVIHSKTRVHFKRLESVVTPYGDTYKLPDRNECTYCQEADRYQTYFPYLLQMLDKRVLVLCEPCHRKSGHPSWRAADDLIIFAHDVPFGINCTTLNLNKVPIMTINQAIDAAELELDKHSTKGHSTWPPKAQPLKIVVDPQHFVYIVIDDLEDCQYWLKDLKRHCEAIPALSLDCEWVPPPFSPNRRPIALLQLATCQGLCLLIRLCRIRIIPTELRRILYNSDILKVGVGITQDVEYLHNDYGITVTNTLDLRFMAETADCEPGGLAQMAAKYVNLTLDKARTNAQIHKNWESPEFTERQTKYAADDVFAGLLLFKYFAHKIQQEIDMNEMTCHLIGSVCKKYIGQEYKVQSKKLPK
ncbi:uncharacterized protein LOC119075879 [Bradysia coprophila]|uniref:uncharacterized protein LOC119075879 n=1 Tax=Bradysia coprophila TaxID=38358 RepID=UPI00187DB608|nr:uncharacterized protein LOC119075879 [Bradysia coprophila]